MIALAGLVGATGLVAGCQARQPQDDPKVAAYVAASQRWYDLTLAELEDVVAQFQASPTYAELAVSWQRVLDKHVADGVQPMHFGRSRDVAGEGEIIKETWNLEQGRIGYVTDARILELVDQSTALVSIQDDPPQPRHRAYIRGVDLTGRTVNEVIDLPTMMEVTGTDIHAATDGGDRTVMVLEPFDIEPYRASTPPGMLHPR